MQLIAFSGSRRLALGTPKQVITNIKEYTTANPQHQILVLDADTSQLVEFDFRGSVDDILASRLAPGACSGDKTGEDRIRDHESDCHGTSATSTAPVASRGSRARTAGNRFNGNSADTGDRPRRGRPRLGVVSREVTLLPRHWEWLADQPGGASATLRRLVDRARRASTGIDEQRNARDSAYRFMTTLAGDAPGYEEAVRALFAGDLQRLCHYLANWPEDIASHAETLASRALAPCEPEP